MRSSMSRSWKLCLLIPVVCLLAGADGEQKMEMKQTASPERLVAAIGRHTETLGEYLSDEASFKDNLKHDQIVSRASSVALLAQGLFEFKVVVGKGSKIDADRVRAGARQITEAESYADAVKGLKEVQAGIKEGIPSSGKPVETLGWDEVVSFNATMEEIKELLGSLKRTHRRSRDPEADSLDAMTVAVLAYSVKSELSYALDDADEAKWKQYATKMHDDFVALDAAMRAKDTDKTREIYGTITESCAACHKDFREQ